MSNIISKTPGYRRQSFFKEDKGSIMQCDIPETGSVLTNDLENESEYEYEYSEVETDVFYLGIDLTSSHGLVRRPRKGPTPAPTPTTGGSTPTVPSSEADSQVPGAIDQGTDTQDSLQILDLHTRNPLVSSYNHIFTCSWADTVGTELVFAHPSHESEPLPLRSHDDYSLISASRAKIIGQKANLISKSNSNSNPSAASSIGQAQAAEPLQPHRPNTSNQARFLEALSQVKRSKGETDTVRTIFPQKRNQNTGDRLQEWARTEAALAEIDRLNRQAIEGDSTALANLMEIYDSRNTNTTSSSTNTAREQEPRSEEVQGDDHEANTHHVHT